MKAELRYNGEWIANVIFAQSFSILDLVAFGVLIPMDEVGEKVKFELDGEVYDWDGLELVY